MNGRSFGRNIKNYLTTSDTFTSNLTIEQWMKKEDLTQPISHTELTTQCYSEYYEKTITGWIVGSQVLWLTIKNCKGDLTLMEARIMNYVL